MRVFVILLLIAVATPAMAASVRHVEEPYHQLAAVRSWCGYAPFGMDISAPTRIEGCFPILSRETSVRIVLQDELVHSPEFYVAIESSDSMRGFSLYACGETQIELPDWAGWVSFYPDPGVYSIEDPVDLPPPFPAPDSTPMPDCMSGSTTGTVALDFTTP